LRHWSCWHGSATSVLTALLARRLPARVSPRLQLVFGLLGVGVGLAMSGLGPAADAAHLLPGLVVAGVANGVLNAALGRQAVASAPAGLASIGSGANNTARYLGGALGVTVVAVLSTHAEPAAMVAGWNHSTLVTAGLSALGALVVAACRPRTGSDRRGRVTLRRSELPIATLGPRGRRSLRCR
jgi:hypothetical protein